MLSVIKFLAVIVGIFLVAIFLVLGAEFIFPKDQAFRTAFPDSSECKTFSNIPNLLLVSNNDENAIKDDSWKCMLQTHQYGGDSEQKYHLSFLEFSDSGQLHLAQQLEVLKDHLARRKNYLIVYVHGWRHGAKQGNRDVKAFRTLLAYAKQFLRYRCSEHKRYCGHEVTGLFVGWRGQSFFDCDDSRFCDQRAALSLFLRKATADRIGIPVTQQILGIQSLIVRGNSSDTPFENSKMLVLGHSLGGNILATGLRDRAVRAVTVHKAGTLLKPILGDLTVLINPASEAKKWIDIQRALRKKLGVNGENATFGRDTPTALRVHKHFGDKQSPIYLSLTSACNWPDFVKKNKDLKDRKIICDTATGKWFSLFTTVKKILSLDFRWTKESGFYEDTITIGHFDPDDACEINTRGRCRVPPNSQKLVKYGATHEFDVNTTRKFDRTTDRRTNYRNSSIALVTRCEVIDGWLSRAQKRAGGLGIKWDAGHIWQPDDHPELALAPVNSTLGINGQFRHELFRGKGVHGNRANYTITSGRDPFWNVRALDSALEEHGGFKNYPTWCALNQLVLDDITNRYNPRTE